MRVLVAVVEAGSFTAGGERLAMSKAAVTRHIADLEARLGVRLLHRTTRKLALTQEGDYFHTRCKEVLAAIETAESEVGSRMSTATGLLRISVPVSYGLLKLAPLWAPFMASHPALRMDINLADRVVDLVAENYDLAVRIVGKLQPTLVSRKLASTKVLMCAAPEYLEQHGVLRHPEDLTHHDILSYSLFSTGDVWMFEGPEGAVSIKLEPRMWTNCGDNCVAIALANGGIVLQPDFLVERELALGTLVEVLPEYHSPELGIYAVFPTRKQMASRVRLLVDYLVDSLADS